MNNQKRSKTIRTISKNHQRPRGDLQIIVSTNKILWFQSDRYQFTWLRNRQFQPSDVYDIGLPCTSIISAIIIHTTLRETLRYRVSPLVDIDSLLFRSSSAISLSLSCSTLRDDVSSISGVLYLREKLRYTSKSFQPRVHFLASFQTRLYTLKA